MMQRELSELGFRFFRFCGAEPDRIALFITQDSYHENQKLKKCI